MNWRILTLKERKDMGNTASLSEKYRPQNLSSIVGNKVVKKSLSATKIINRIPQSILFSGKHGIGKTTFARAYAKLINCSSPIKIDGIIDSCGMCGSCLELKNGNPIDFTEINAADQRGIDDMRSLISRCEMGLTDLKHRIIIIDECQQLRADSQNILLKPLESSDINTVFMFCTTNPEKILSTVKSRCRKYHLRSIPNTLILNHLQSICNLEKIDYEDKALSIICDESQGSMRDAINLLDQACGHDKITEEIVSAFTNILSLDIIYSLFENIVSYNMSEIYKCIEVIDSRNIPADKLLDLYIIYLNDMLVYLETNNSSLLRYSGEQYFNKVRSHSEILKKQETIRHMMKIVINAYKSLESYPRHKHLLNLVFSESCEMLQRSC